MRRLPVVYVAGSFRGANSWEIEQNVRRAEETSLAVWRLGVAALCPHTSTRFFQGAAPDKVWLEGTLELLRRCDAVVLVQGDTNRERSSGTQGELAEARRLGKPIFETIDELDRWTLSVGGLA